MKHRTGLKRAARLSVMAVAMTPLIGCAGMKAAGSDAGCISYGEARLSMPSIGTLPGEPWGRWIADLDDRMTGTCR